MSGLSASLKELGKIETAWDQPSDTGIGALGSYRYRVSYDGGKTWGPWTDTESTSHTIDVETGATHSFEVRATSDAVHQLGAASRLSPPGPPGNLSIDPGDINLTVTWDAPADDGGSAITSYVLQYRRETEGHWRDMPLTEDFSTVTIDSLENNQRYQVRIAGQNVFGLGDYSVPRTASPVNSPPSAPPVENQTATELQSFSYSFDDVADLDGHQSTFSASLADGTPLPAWLDFDEPNRTFSGTPEDADTGSLTIVVKATDNGTPPASSQAAFILTVVDVNQMPAPPRVEDQRAGAGLFFSYTIPETTDPDSRDTLSYSAALTDGAELPIWLGFQINTLIFSGTATSGDAGTLDIAVIATDNGTPPMSSEGTFTLEVIYNSPPSTPGVSDQRATEAEEFVYTFEASTDEDNHTITYSVVMSDDSPLPGWLSFDGEERTFRGTPLELDSPKRHQIRVIAIDDGWPTASSQGEFELWVPEVDSPPIADAGPDLAGVESGSTVTLDGSGSYDPEGATISYCWEKVAGPPVEPIDPELEESEKCGDPETYKEYTFIALQPGTLIFRLVVEDEYLPSEPDFVSITIDSPPGQISPAPLFGPASIKEQVYWLAQDVGMVQLPEAIGSAGTITYLLSPSLPPGLAFDPVARTITGAPTEPFGRRLFTYTAIDEVGSEASLRFYVTVNTPIAVVQTAAQGAATITALASGESDLTFMVGGETLHVRVKVDTSSIGSRLTLTAGPYWASLALIEFSGTPTDDIASPMAPQGFRVLGEPRVLSITLRDVNGINMDHLDAPATICLTSPRAGDGVLLILRHDDAEGWSILASTAVTSEGGGTAICAGSARISTFAAGYAEPLPPPRPTATPTPPARQQEDGSPSSTPTPVPTAVSVLTPTPNPTNLPEQMELIPTPPPSPTPHRSAESAKKQEPTPTRPLSPTPTALPNPVEPAKPTASLPPGPTPSSAAASPTRLPTVALPREQTPLHDVLTPMPTPSQVEHLRGPDDSTRIWVLIGIPIGILILGATFFLYRRSLSP